MSSRVLRKLQGDKEFEISLNEDEDDFTFVAVESKKKNKSVANPFALVSGEKSVF